MHTFTIALPCLALFAVAPLASAENLLKNSGFEEPKITGRVDAKKGGSPARGGIETTWSNFQSMDLSGKLNVGVTDEIARSGKQSVYVDFNQAERTYGAHLMSDLIPIKAAEKYRVSIWGRVDRKRPLTLDQGRAYQLLEVEFYPADQASRIDETEVRTQMIPGMPDRLLFVSSKWTEYYAEFVAPEGAEFVKVTFKWESPKREGAADGIIYFDDAAVEGVAGTSVPSLDPPAPVEPPSPPVTPAGTSDAASPGAAQKAPASPPSPPEK